jgi:hypothetical protein
VFPEAAWIVGDNLLELIRRATLLACVLAISSPVLAQQAQQHVAPSWHGLSGLYVTPTARTIGARRVAFGYSESKHAEILDGGSSHDRQIRADLVYGVSDRLEVGVSYLRDLFDVDWTFQPQIENKTSVLYDAKYLIVKEDQTGMRSAIALAVRDIGDTDRDTPPLTDMHNGRKIFLLASKRLRYKPETGGFIDGHLGVSHNYHGTSGLFGMEMTMSPTISFIAEGMYDSPFVNFRNSYMNARKTGTSDHKGRFIYCMGLRMYPDIAPGMVVDTGVVGDGSFAFSFGVSFVRGL